ncbi:CHAT domain-containing protein [Hyalangium gracile]|uniref:CHAT domain-containing protein n=1 Tax=Hyalangium gracile TaxID=394092 RepID=UPI001CCDC71D|nr:CHAT domain-containing protein [Hyalangium gracile]
MWRAIGWTLVVGLCCAVGVEAGQESTEPRRIAARTALDEAQRRLDEALPILSRALDLSEEHLRREAVDLSAPRLMSHLRLLRTDEERIYALLQAHPDDARVRRLAMTAVLLRKGRFLEESSSRFRSLSRGIDPRDHESFEQLRALRTRLAMLSLQGAGSLPAAEHQRRLSALAEQTDALEAELVRRSAPQRARTALPPPGRIVDRVAASLPRDGALIEFIAYEARGHSSEQGQPTAQGRGPLRYLALVLFPDGRLHAIDLGPAEPIDSAASALVDAFAIRDAAYQAPARTLYALAFEPLRPVLGKARRIYLSPDGQLGLVPFHALHDGKDFLTEAFTFTLLTSGRDLLPRPEAPAFSGPMVVLADPDLGSPAPVPDFSESMKSALALRMTLPDPRELWRGVLGDTAWLPLPGTRQEAEAIRRLFPKAQLFLGAEATKERLLGLNAPSILHVATHGFSHEDVALTPGARALTHVGTFSAQASVQLPQSSMLSSGLLLASEGARKAEVPSGGRRSEAAPVTALELAGLDLWGTELVVLSACDTGRGAVELGQGVHGLRRALVIAGAETVVMSLWQVNDETTRLLMESYYRHLLAGKGRTEALHDAMRALRETHPHPYYWAPFITLGRDGPLRSLGFLPTQPSTP